MARGIIFGSFSQKSGTRTMWDQQPITRQALCLRWWYHMDGSDVGTLSVHHIVVGEGVCHLEQEGFSENLQTMASVGAVCTFEQGSTCGMEADSEPGWTLAQASPTDHTTATQQGHAYELRGGSNPVTSKLKSPAITVEDTECVGFYYWMEGTEDASLTECVPQNFCGLFFRQYNLFFGPMIRTAFSGFPQTATVTRLSMGQQMIKGKNTPENYALVMQGEVWDGREGYLALKDFHLTEPEFMYCSLVPESATPESPSILPPATILPLLVDPKSSLDCDFENASHPSCGFIDEGEVGYWLRVNASSPPNVYNPIIDNTFKNGM
ncbi:MAM and LDL-receptor class A domain-containing protein 1 [Chionoecetes opilio]|uniref:MAM and LDL-receptor class A domain-containing protein 1 n=1 Tax=Chionoecetes opilio TaxID=41210 RepID=A0A8J4XWB9_CHIOP|nr:MAM and LDL-receptor class A domain-containing protein 1 [Chionoecetes opilio]